MGENCKGELQEWCMKRGNGCPKYTIHQTQDSHGHMFPMFQAKVEIDGEVEAIIGEAQRKKKDAEQSAASKMLSHLGIQRKRRTNIDLMHYHASLQQEQLGTTGPVPKVAIGGQVLKIEPGTNSAMSVNGNGEQVGSKRDTPPENAMAPYLPPTKSSKLNPGVDHPRVEPDAVKKVVMIDGENLPTIVSKIVCDDTQQVIIYFSRTHPLARTNYGENIAHHISPSTRPDGSDIFMAMDVMCMPRRYPNLEKITIYTRDKFASAVVDNLEHFYPSIRASHDSHIDPHG